MTEEERIFAKAFENLDRAEENRRALLERRVQNLSDGDVLLWERQQSAMQEVVRKTREDALESAPCGCTDAQVTHVDLRAAVDTVIEVCGSEVGLIEARILRLIDDLKKLVEKNNDR